jgi:hypothetical protein
MYLLLGPKNLYACFQLDCVKEYVFDFYMIFNFEWAMDFGSSSMRFGQQEM